MEKGWKREEGAKTQSPRQGEPIKILRVFVLLKKRKAEYMPFDSGDVLSRIGLKLCGS